MGVQKTEVVSTSPVPAGKMYHGLLIDMDNVVPKALPNAFKSVEILEGDGGVGTVKHVALGEVSRFNTMKLRIDAIDKEELTFSYSIIGGDILFDFIESIVNHFTVVPTANGGCTVKNTTIFTTKGDVVIPEENIKQATEQSKTIYHAVETYLLAN